jgi:hypothetical protein
MERIIHGSPQTDSTGLINNSVLYKEFLAEREEILCHKWIESEKAGYDIGFERALMDWALKYRSAWLEKRLVFIRSSLAPFLPFPSEQPPFPSRTTTPPLRL